MKIHKFFLNGLHIVLDINSGAVHIVDKMVYEILDVYDGTNKAAALEALSGRYDEAELEEAIGELEELIREERLFSPDLPIPGTFQEKPLVKSLCLHIAHDCNLRCGYCFAGTGDFGHDRGLMSPEVACQAVDFLVEKSGPRRHSEIDFFGGEPLMNMKTVKAAIEHIRRREKETGKSFQLTLTTNGVLLTPEITEYLNENGILLVLSLDGRKEVHDKMRPFSEGIGSYDKVMPNLKFAAQSRNDRNYYLRGTFTAHNLDFAADVLSMADAGFSQLSVEPVVGKDEDYSITEEHLPTLFAEYEKLALAYLERRKAGKGFDFFHFNLDLSNGPCVAKRLSGCGAGHEYMAVTPEGDLYPCHQFVGREEFKLGDVYNGVENQVLPQQFRQTHVMKKKECSTCWARLYCSGGCHANAHQFNGTIEEPYKIGCELQKKRLECAIMIQAIRAIEG